MRKVNIVCWLFFCLPLEKIVNLSSRSVKVSD